MFWNVENFFDYHDSGHGESDTEWSAMGDRHWTRKRFIKKCIDIAKTILWSSDECLQMPDIVSFAELENRFVLRQLLELTPLRKFDYDIVHFDSPDRRGIDVGLVYRRQRLRLCSARPASVPGLTTRDMLVTTFVRVGGDSLAVVVCHHPSKYGGASSSSARQKAVETLLSISDSLNYTGWHKQLFLGDFNDTPDSAIYDTLKASLKSLSEPLARDGNGTIKFEGHWELIDQAFVSPELDSLATQTIFSPSFLTVRDTSHPGTKPSRTYSGPRYLGGVSDHYPILVTLTGALPP